MVGSTTKLAGQIEVNNQMTKIKTNLHEVLILDILTKFDIDDYIITQYTEARTDKLNVSMRKCQK